MSDLHPRTLEASRSLPRRSTPLVGAARRNTRIPGTANTELLLQDSVAVLEHGSYEPPSYKRRKPRLKGEPVGQQGAVAARLQLPFVTPHLHAEHGRLLEKAFTRIET